MPDHEPPLDLLEADELEVAIDGADLNVRVRGKKGEYLGPATSLSICNGWLLTRQDAPRWSVDVSKNSRHVVRNRGQVGAGLFFRWFSQLRDVGCLVL